MKNEDIENFIYHLRITFEEWGKNKDYENTRNVETAVFLFKDILKYIHRSK